MKFFAAAVLLFLATAARADTTTSRYSLIVPSTGTPGYGLKINDWAVKLDTMTASLFKSNTFGQAGSSNTFIGPVDLRTIASTLTVQGNAFSVGSTSFTVTGGTAAVAYGLTAGSIGIGGAPSGTRKFQVYFNANNNSISYGDEAGAYCDPNNGLCLSFGGLYGKGSLYLQAHNGFGGSKLPLGIQSEGGGTAFGTYAPTSATTTVQVQGGLSVNANGNTQFSLQTSSGASFGSDAHVTGTLEATKLKGDGCQLTGIGGGGTVTTQGSPAAGQIAVFQTGTVLSSSPISVAYGTGGVTTTTISGAVMGPMPSSSSATFSAVTSSTIPLVSVSSVVYSLKGIITPSGNSRLLLQVSGDNTASWNWVSRGNSVGGQDTQSGSAVAFCALTESNATNNSPIRGVPTLYDLTVIVTPTDIVVHAMPAYRGLSTDPAVEVNGTCTWERAGFSFSNLVITMSDGSTMSGSWYLNKW